MKKIPLLLVVIMAITLIAACVPVEPKDVLPYCKSAYEGLLIDDPDYPPAFVGACVSYFQTGKATAFVSLCKYEPFRDSLEIPSITTQKDCIQYIINLEE